MSVFVDSMYVNQLSPRLRNFKKKRNDLWNFSCPICGDSKKDAKKARGFVYARKGQLFYKCYNCPASSNFANFLKEVDPTLYDAYLVDRYAEGNEKNIKKDEILRVMDFKQPEFRKQKEILIGLNTIASLDENHPAKQYIKSRQIPVDFWRDMFWTEDFRDVAIRFDKKYEKLKPNDARIVVPFVDSDDKVTAIQGRTLDKDNKLRYITVKASDCATKVYGLDRVKRNELIYVVEGLFDSMFLPNCIAAACSDLRVVEDFVPKQKCVLVPDRQPKNREIVRQIGKFVKDGWSVCLLPNSLKSKDINDYILCDGKAPQELLDIIQRHTYSGLELEFEFSNWREVKNES